MKKLCIRTSLYIFFALVLFFLGVEVSHLPINEELARIHLSAEEDLLAKEGSSVKGNSPSVEDALSIEADEISQMNEIERIRNNQIEKKAVFSQAGVWLSESVSNRFVRILEKIFS